MSIFLNENSKVIVQGMTGSEGRKHTQRMLASGTAIVGGVNPGKAGQTVDFDGASVPVFGQLAGGRSLEDQAAAEEPARRRAQTLSVVALAAVIALATVTAALVRTSQVQRAARR